MQVRSGIDVRRTAMGADGGGADAQLQHAIDRDVRSGQDRAVLALHLSRLHPPAPRSHHRRIARALLEDAAQAHSGQVVVRGNADVVLLCEPAGAPRVRDMLVRLFRTDASDPNDLVSLWHLPDDAISIEGYLTRSIASAAAPEGPVYPPSNAAAMEAAMASGQLTDIIRRQTAVQVIAGGMTPLFRKLSFRLDALGARVEEAGPGLADPFLAQHFAGRLDRRMMDLLGREMSRPGQTAPDPALHISLSLRAILSPGFLRLAQATASAAAKLGIEVALTDAFADPLAFGAARMVLQAHHCVLVLDAVSHQALLLSRCERLRPDLVKLDWAPRMANLGSAERHQLGTAMHRIGAKRIILQHADMHAAVSWGLTHGISRFQGLHVDAMLAAGRMAGCAQAAACTVRQCLDRAAATGSAGRAGCRNTAALDSVQIPQALPV